MLPVLRLMSLVAGLAVAAVPVAGVVWFGLQTGKPWPTVADVQRFASPVALGLALGGGLIVVGLSRVVCGSVSPVTSVVAGALLCLSSALTMRFGFDGAVSSVSTMLLMLEFIAFAAFVWPASGFVDRRGHAA